MRRWLMLVLLCVALPAQALAAGWASFASCPMQAAATGDPSSPAGDDPHDCCNDAETTAWTGQHCRSADCGAMALAMPAARPHAAQRAPRLAPPAGRNSPWPPDVVFAPWRPPPSL